MNRQGYIRPATTVTRTWAVWAFCAAAVLLPAVSARAQLCGGTHSGDCCVENSNPGCNDAACCNTVCAVDPFCCATLWDQLCADQAAVLCAPGTCPGSCPGDGDCCVENGTPGCDNAACCQTVCNSDPACCDVVWDSACASLAESLCNPGTCPGSCPGEGDCCVANGTPGCDDAACCATVCGIDPACCDLVWDDACATLADSMCAPGTCPGACPGEGDCCVANGTPGCENAACCDAVCASDPSCCDVIWDAACAALAESICDPGTCPGDCPGEGDCCVENGTPGCRDALCCSTVCATDPFCCDVIWDQQCADLAVATCSQPVICFGDADGDNDVDLADHAVFYDCLAGPDVLPGPAPPADILECLQAFDADGDSDIDLRDFRYFMNVFTGEL